MSSVQIGNLPAVAAAAGSDLYETVQSGVSSKVTLSQITTYVQSQMGAGVTGLSFGTTGLLPSALTGGAITVTGTLIPANGGTGIASYVIGDILVASSTTALSKLAIGAASLPLVSTGTTVGYSVLTVPGGGTGVATLTNHGVLLGQGASALVATAVGATGQVLIGNTGADPSWVAATGVAVTSLSFGTTGLTPNSATQGAITVAGTLVPANGGTGIASYTIGDLIYASGATTLSKLADVGTGNVLLSGGVGVAPAWGKVDLTAAVSNTLPVANGGSGVATRTIHSIQVGNGTSAVTQLAVGTTGQVLTGSTGADPAWAAATSVSVTSISFGTTGLTPNSATQGAIVVSGTLIAANGGTGFASYAVGDLLYANTTTTLAKLADVATGSILVSGGVGVAPAWAAATGVAVTSISFGTTGLTPNSATQGAITVAGTLVVSNGGTGAATLTGVLKGNGTSAFTAATAGSDYVAPGTATTFTAKQTFNGTTAILAANFINVVEPITISATAATGTINYDGTTQSILYYTTNASANWTVNFRASSGTSLNTAMSTGEAITFVFMVTQGATAYYNSAVQVDGNAITPKWQGGTAPTAGNVSGIDVYSYTIIKTGNAAFTILASQTQFK